MLRNRASRHDPRAIESRHQRRKGIRHGRSRIRPRQIPRSRPKRTRGSRRACRTRTSRWPSCTSAPRDASWSGHSGSSCGTSAASGASNPLGTRRAGRSRGANHPLDALTPCGACRTRNALRPSGTYRPGDSLSTRGSCRACDPLGSLTARWPGTSCDSRGAGHASWSDSPVGSSRASATRRASYSLNALYPGRPDNALDSCGSGSTCRASGSSGTRHALHPLRTGATSWSRNTRRALKPRGPGRASRTRCTLGTRGPCWAYRSLRTLASGCSCGSGDALRPLRPCGSRCALTPCWPDSASRAADALSALGPRGSYGSSCSCWACTGRARGPRDPSRSRRTGGTLGTRAEYLNFGDSQGSRSQGLGGRRGDGLARGDRHSSVIKAPKNAIHA